MEVLRKQLIKKGDIVIFSYDAYSGKSYLNNEEATLIELKK